MITKLLEEQTIKTQLNRELHRIIAASSGLLDLITDHTPSHVGFELRTTESVCRVILQWVARYDVDTFQHKLESEAEECSKLLQQLISDDAYTQTYVKTIELQCMTKVLEMLSDLNNTAASEQEINNDYASHSTEHHSNSNQTIMSV